MWIQWSARSVTWGHLGFSFVRVSVSWFHTGLIQYWADSWKSTCVSGSCWNLRYIYFYNCYPDVIFPLLSNFYSSIGPSEWSDICIPHNYPYRSSWSYVNTSHEVFSWTHFQLPPSLSRHAMSVFIYVFITTHPCFKPLLVPSIYLISVRTGVVLSRTW